jgi:hypothetical protein
MHATCFAHLILFDLITLVIFRGIEHIIPIYFTVSLYSFAFYISSFVSFLLFIFFTISFSFFLSFVCYLFLLNLCLTSMSLFTLLSKSTLKEIVLLHSDALDAENSYLNSAWIIVNASNRNLIFNSETSLFYRKGKKRWSAQIKVNKRILWESCTVKSSFMERIFKEYNPAKTIKRRQKSCFIYFCWSSVWI